MRVCLLSQALLPGYGFLDRSVLCHLLVLLFICQVNPTLPNLLAGFVSFKRNQQTSDIDVEIKLLYPPGVNPAEREQEATIANVRLKDQAANGSYDQGFKAAVQAAAIETGDNAMAGLVNKAIDDGILASAFVNFTVEAGEDYEGEFADGQLCARELLRCLILISELGFAPTPILTA